MAVLRLNAQTTAAYYDSAGFPRCVANPADPTDGILFLWDQNLYFSRPIYGVSLRNPRFAMASTTWPQGCANWPAYEREATRDLLWTSLFDAVPANATRAQLSTGGYAWSAEVAARLAIAASGANVYRGSMTAQDYVARARLPTFTRQLNRSIASRYGAFFAADVYAEWLKTLPRNEAMRARILRHIALERAHREARSVARRFAGYELLFAEGYMQAADASRVRPFYDELDALGARYRKMDYDRVGPLQINSVYFERQLEAALRADGPRAILVGASKGAPEMLMGLARLNAREPALVRRRLAAVISLAGMFEGSFLVDWAGSGIQALFVKSSLSDEAKKAKLTLDSLDGFYAMSTASLAAASTQYRASLPNVRYYDCVGVLDGEARDGSIATLQKKLTFERVGASGGNDGYIEYPGTMMPRSLGLDSTEIVFRSSHVIFDGAFEGYDLMNPSAKRLVVGAVLQAVADDIEADPRP